jgi:hypothetical protein
MYVRTCVCVYLEDLCVHMYCSRVLSNTYNYLSNKCKYVYMYVVLPIHIELCVYVLPFMVVHSHLCFSLVCQKHIKRK